MHGILPTELPHALPNQRALPRELADFSWLRIPKGLMPELVQLTKLVGSRSRTLEMNLDYELSGIGCVSAAVPSRVGTYAAYRRLEWSVGYAPKFHFAQLGQGIGKVRYTPGYVGALSGYTPEWHVSMNYSPTSHHGIDWYKQPASWVLREALARGMSYGKTKEWLLQQRVIREAYVTLVGKDKASWLIIGPFGAVVHKEVSYPTPLVVCNSEYEGWLDPTYWRAVTSAPYQAPSIYDFVLDRYTVQL